MQENRKGELCAVGGVGERRFDLRERAVLQVKTSEESAAKTDLKCERVALKRLI